MISDLREDGVVSAAEDEHRRHEGSYRGAAVRPPYRVDNGVVEGCAGRLPANKAQQPIS